MRKPKPAADELASLYQRSAAEFVGATNRLARAVIRNRPRGPAIDGLAEVIAQTMTLADLFGRRRLLLEADWIDEHQPQELEDVQAFATPIVPRIPFKEALRDLAKREPRLAQTADLVAELYQDRHGFGLAKSAEKEITEAVKRAVAGGISGRLTDPESIIQKLGKFSRAYAETVYRTNVSTAYTAGRLQQVREDPAVQAVIGGFEYNAVGDADTRRGRPKDNGENHQAADGLVASANDAIWKTTAPPNGYGCRCGLRMVGKAELKRRGLLEENGRVQRFDPPGFASFAPHPRFARSGVARIYGT